MDGKKLTRLVLDALDELEVNENYASPRKIYENLEWACTLFLRETLSYKKTKTITTVAGQQIYDLDPDFIGLYMKNEQGRYVVKYNDGANDSWPTQKSYEKLYRSNQTTAKAIPNNFALRLKPTLSSEIVCYANTAASPVGGQLTLTGATITGGTLMNAASLKPRDLVHNLTDNSDGYVLLITSASIVNIALFDGTNDDISIGDEIVFSPAARQQIVLDAPSESSGHTITVECIALPSPVYSDFGQWELEYKNCRAIAWGAASIFKVPTGEMADSQILGGFFADEVRRYRNEQAKQALHQRRYRNYW